MSYSILYGSQNMDAVNLLTYINDFTKGIGETEVKVDPDVCFSITELISHEFPHVDGVEQASVFKKLAYFMSYFIGERPIKSNFSAENIGPDLVKISNHSNAIIALQLAFDSLEGAKIISGKGNERTKKILKSRIKISNHSYIDIVDSLHNITVSQHFKLLAVFLEQLTYKENPDCQYELIDI